MRVRMRTLLQWWSMPRALDRLISVLLLLAVALVLPDVRCQQADGVGGGNPLSGIVVQMGRAMVERQIHRNLFYGHHNRNTSFTPYYDAGDLVEAGWEPLIVPVPGADDDDDGGDVLVVRRKDGMERAKSLDHGSGCHVMFFHGNNLNLLSILEDLDAFEERLQCLVYAMEYTGYRTDKPEASPSEAAITAEALAATEWLLDQVGPDDKVFLFGHSLGAGVAVDVADQLARREGEGKWRTWETPRSPHDAISGIILEAPFLTAVKTVVDYDDEASFQSSLDRLGAAMPMFKTTIDGLTSSFIEPMDKFRNEDKIELVGSRWPVFVGHAINDKVNPYEHGKKLFDLIEGDRKTAVFLESDAHTLHDEDGPESALFFSALQSFVSKAMLEGTHAGRQRSRGSEPRVNANSGPSGPVDQAQPKSKEWARSELWDSFLRASGSGEARASSLSTTIVPPNLKVRSVGEAGLLGRTTGAPASGRPKNRFGRISASRDPVLQFDADAGTQTVNIVVEITADGQSEGDPVAVIQTSRLNKLSPQVSSVVGRRVGPQVSHDHLVSDVVNRYNKCTFTTSIGSRSSGLKVVDKLTLHRVWGSQPPRSKGSIVLPAKTCKVSPDKSQQYLECREYKYQFLNEETCEVSQALVAADV
ncbi:alpha/beta hydrolase [Chloropicon primus]|uniref:Alpha/beta hydrolase n=1 Tax=Chloropicon primus TaxID=1764295 RepID=A0A5B8N1J6_9CHLO|nr:alpha/beta hydrolase [Chloropicon primus]UPR04950.1 alpha/beta hydrolase [Chloropicon primus]|eukprot:QDZ25755.1 alpha/beta hydrolase [Chloropicon primus]